VICRSRKRCTDYSVFNHRKHLRIFVFLFLLLANIAHLWARPTKRRGLFTENTVANWHIHSCLRFRKVTKDKIIIFELRTINNKTIIRCVNLWLRRSRRRCVRLRCFQTLKTLTDFRIPPPILSKYCSLLGKACEITQVSHREFCSY
jgi:hypothetical protein